MALAAMSSRLMVIPTTLVSIPGLSVGHYKNFKQEGDYCVWAEDTEPSAVSGDNRKVIQTLQGTIDFYTRSEFNPIVDAIQERLNTAGVSFYLNSVQYEDETGFIHFEWVFEV